MELIRKTKVIITKNGNKIRYGEFLCAYCLQEVERQLGNGKVAKSCGCKQYSEERANKISLANKGKKRNPYSEETKQKISINNKGKHSNKRKIVSEETKQKMREKALGRLHTEETKQKIREIIIKNGYSKGKNNPMYGKKRTEEVRQKISKTRIEKGVAKLENNPAWQNGKSFEIYPQEFNKQKKQYILERDNYVCQDLNCEHKTNKLHIHHIDYDKKNNTDENLITLYHSCHAKTIGKNRIYYTEFYQNIMINRLIDCLL